MSAVRPTHQVPTLVLNLTDGMTSEDIVNLYLESVSIGLALEYPVLRLFDLRGAENTYADLYGALQSLAQGVGGAMLPPSLDGAVIGKPSMAHYFAAHQVPFFESTDAAMAALQAGMSLAA